MTKRVRIGIDARELLGDATGVGRYLGELVRRWSTRPDASHRTLVLYTPEPLELSLPDGHAEVRVVGAGRGTWWEQMHLRRAVRADAPDVFFAPGYTAPIGIDIPLAVTIHDVSFFAHPEWFRPEEGFRRRWLTAKAAQAARVVFADSVFSRTEIVRYQLVEPERIRVIPPGVSPPVLPAHVAREPMVLFVGSVFNRRRLPDLISAFARATSDLPHARLALVGPDRTWPPQDLRAVAIDRGVSERTVILSYAANDTLSDLYARASVFAFLSEYEGFGLTPLEAMAAGIPAVVLDTPVAREVYGDAVVFVERDDVRGTADALRRLLVEPASAAAIVSRAAEVLRRYSWDTAATDTLDNLERIAAR